MLFRIDLLGRHKAIPQRLLPPEEENHPEHRGKQQPSVDRVGHGQSAPWGRIEFCAFENPRAVGRCRRCSRWLRSRRRGGPRRPLRGIRNQLPTDMLPLTLERLIPAQRDHEKENPCREQLSHDLCLRDGLCSPKNSPGGGEEAPSRLFVPRTSSAGVALPRPVSAWSQRQGSACSAALHLRSPFRSKSLHGVLAMQE